ncbi:hypothetical protein BBJ28_00019327 [Nothophytophthora sp. Chile5]|nr:hypothetical protein BBJ28_00019327 [Nothophytophthora sp. Chile5]
MRSFRCYSTKTCWDDASSTAKWAKWSNMWTKFRIVFYQGEECQGDYYASVYAYTGSVVFSKVGLKHGVSSFMVWDYGVYATSGFSNICDESAVLLIANGTGTTANRSLSELHESAEETRDVLPHKLQPSLV